MSQTSQKNLDISSGTDSVALDRSNALSIRSAPTVKRY